MNNQLQGRNPGAMMRFGSGNLDDLPEKNSSMFTLQFDENETLMSPSESEETTATPAAAGRASTGRGGNRNMNRPGSGARVNIRRSSQPGQDKIYYQNLDKGTAELQLELDEKYLLQDTLQHITWRFTDEYRNIAGYDCRRVNGATPDSLYIVAFYTDQIPVSGGPALVNGLPGMILGLAIPEMHINYWARKVEFTVDNVPRQWQDKKSKTMSMQDFFDTLGSNRMFGGGATPQQQRRNLLENLIY